MAGLRFGMSLGDSQPEVFEVIGHVNSDGGELGFEGGDFLFHGTEVDFSLLFEGVHVARDVEVEVVVGEFLRGGCLRGLTRSCGR
ncbi:MAG: hypothetical protein RLZZ398_1314 [Verrucomicrobiota bacterium]